MRISVARKTARSTRRVDVAGDLLLPRLLASLQQKTLLFSVIFSNSGKITECCFQIFFLTVFQVILILLKKITEK